MSRFLSPSRRLVAVDFFIQLAFQSTYFVGIIGCGTYVLGAGAFETSALVFGLNLVLTFQRFAPVHLWTPWARVAYSWPFASYFAHRAFLALLLPCPIPRLRYSPSLSGCCLARGPRPWTPIRAF